MQINKDCGLVKAFLHFNRLTKQHLSLLFHGGMQKPSGQREKINEKSKDPVNLEKVPYFSFCCTFLQGTVCICRHLDEFRQLKNVYFQLLKTLVKTTNCQVLVLQYASKEICCY